MLTGMCFVSRIFFKGPCVLSDVSVADLKLKLWIIIN